jgi:hypothetical protein
MFFVSSRLVPRLQGWRLAAGGGSSGNDRVRDLPSEANENLATSIRQC